MDRKFWNGTFSEGLFSNSLHSFIVTITVNSKPTNYKSWICDKVDALWEYKNWYSYTRSFPEANFLIYSVGTYTELNQRSMYYWG